MYRFMVVVVLCGLLAHATNAWSRDTSLRDLADNPFDRSNNEGRYPVTETEETDNAGKATYEKTLDLWSDPKGWMERTFANIQNKIKGYLNAGENDVEDPRPTPAYEELCTPNVPFGYEARNYSSSVWVSVDIVNRFSDVAVLYAKTKLEKYFHGSNDRNLTIEMTKPLRMKRAWPTGSYPGVDKMTFTYSLYLPPELHTNPPKPNDTNLTIHTEPPTTFFARNFSSYTFSFRNYQELFNLRDLLNQRKERFLHDEFFVEVYDPSSTVLNRRNEILVLMSPNVAKPTCKVKTTTVVFNDQKQPKYNELCSKKEKYEARMYAKSIWVSTTVRALSSQLAGITALPKLDKYFNMYNDQGVKIPKTEPVRVTQAWPSSVFNPTIYMNYTYSYYLPLAPTSGIPQPLDSKLFIADEPAATMFALNFSTFDFFNMQKLQELTTYLNEQGEDYLSSEPVSIEIYTPPSIFVNRHNEVLVHMNPLARQPKCASNAFPPCLHRDKECPSYRILKNLTADIERRNISSNLYVMKRTGTCNMTIAYDNAYMPLHRYFRGANSMNETIGRTTPVILVHKSTEHPTQGCDFTYNLMFYLPADRHDNAPEPTEDGVEFKRDEAKEAFVMTFEESATNNVVTAKETKLCSELDRLGLCYSKDEFFIATYDAPWRPVPHRHEIWIPQVECVTSSVEGPGYIVLGNGCDEGCECPSYESIRSYETFEERNYGESMWVCKKTVSCNVEQAFNDSITTLYEYFQSSYDIEPKARPVISYLSVPNFLSDGCNKEINTCAYLPETASRLPLLTPSDDLTLLTVPSDEHPWQKAFVTTVQGQPTVTNIQSSMTSLLQKMTDADLFHSNRVFVARYTFPWEDAHSHIEVGALTDTYPTMLRGN